MDAGGVKESLYESIALALRDALRKFIADLEGSESPRMS
jgi:hypothetical protein